MSVSYFLLVFLFQTTLAASKNLPFCSYNEGKIDFCRFNKFSNDTKFDVLHTLRLPIHAKHVLLGRLPNFELADLLVLPESELDRRRVFPLGESGFENPAGCRFDSDESDLTRFVDLSDQKIIEDAWYVMCAQNDVKVIGEVENKGINGTSFFREMNITIQNDKCITCSPLKFTSPFDLINYSFLENPFSAVGPKSLLRFTTKDMPFESMIVTGSVFNVEEETAIFNFSHVIKPRQRVYVQLPCLEKYKEFAVSNDFYPLSKNGTEFMMGGVALKFHDSLSQYVREGGSSDCGHNHHRRKDEESRSREEDHERPHSAINY